MNIDYISFKTDLYNSTIATKHDPSSLTSTLSALLDKHAPRICYILSIHTNSPWFNSDICSLKRHTRKLDRLYRKTHTHQNHSNFILAFNSYRRNMFNTKSEFYQSKITAAGTNIKTLNKIMDILLGRFKQTQLPDIPDELLCNTFAEIIETIHNNLTNTASTSNYNWLPTQLKKSDSYLCFYRFLSVLMRIGFKSIPKIKV